MDEQAAEGAAAGSGGEAGGAGLAEGRGWSWLAWGIPVAAAAAGLDLLLFRLYLASEVSWKAWEHKAGADWHWMPFIHPPLFNQYMRAFERWSARTGRPEGELLILVAAALAPLLVLLCARLAADGPPRGVQVGLACLLLALSPARLRPLEQYPVAALALSAAVVSLLLWWRRGGVARWLPAAVLVLLTVEFHLASWFLLLPLLVMLAVPGDHRRRRGLGWLAASVLALFWVSTQDVGLFGNTLADVFAQPGVRERTIFNVRSFRHLTFEYSNPVLYLPLLLWLVPGLRRREPRGLAVLVAVAAYVAVHLALMQQGLAVHGGASEPHHYFSLVEPLVVAGSVWALAAAWQEWPARRKLVGAALVVVAASQVLMFGHVLRAMARAAPLF